MATNRDTLRGEVIEALPNLEYRIKLEDEREVRCYMAGRMKLNKIRIIIGDKVLIVYPQGSSIGRIVRRV